MISQTRTLDVLQYLTAISASLILISAFTVPLLKSTSLSNNCMTKQIGRTTVHQEIHRCHDSATFAYRVHILIITTICRTSFSQKVLRENVTDDTLTGCLRYKLSNAKGQQKSRLHSARGMTKLSPPRGGPVELPRVHASRDAFLRATTRQNTK